MLSCTSIGLNLWRDTTLIGRSLRAVPFGRPTSSSTWPASPRWPCSPNLRQAVSVPTTPASPRRSSLNRSLDDTERAELAEDPLFLRTGRPNRTQVLDDPRWCAGRPAIRMFRSSSPGITTGGFRASNAIRLPGGNDVHSTCRGDGRRAERIRTKAPQRRHGRMVQKAWCTASFIGLRGVPGDFRCAAPRNRFKACSTG